MIIAIFAGSVKPKVPFEGRSERILRAIDENRLMGTAQDDIVHSGSPKILSWTFCETLQTGSALRQVTPALANQVKAGVFYTLQGSKFPRVKS